MKQILFALVTVCFFSITTTNAQNQVFRKGNFNYSVALGAVPTFFADNANINVPPVSMRLGYNVSNHFNLNAMVGFSGTTSTMTTDVLGNQRQYRNNFLMLGLRGELHAAKTEKLDIYGGFMLGYNKSFIDETIIPNGGDTPIDAPSDSPTPFKPQGSKVIYSGFVGATYFVSKKVGLFGEIGYGVSLLNLGATFKI